MNVCWLVRLFPEVTVNAMPRNRVRGTRRPANGALSVAVAASLVSATLGAQATAGAPDTLPWTTRSEVFRDPGCSGRECSSAELSWPDFGKRVGPQARVNELLMVSMVVRENASAANQRRRSVAAVGKEFLDAARKGSAAGMPWDAKRTISVACNTPTRVLLRSDESSFTGGAHGNFFSLFRAFSPRTGARVSEAAMVPLAARPGILPLVERAFRRERELPASGSLAEVGYTFKDDRFELSTAFLAVCGSSLFVHWNVYSIASYAAGPIHLIIPLDSVPTLRR